MLNVHRTVSNMPYDQLHISPSIYITLPNVLLDQGRDPARDHSCLIHGHCWLLEDAD
jgi:hypothetical protein